MSISDWGLYGQGQALAARVAGSYDPHMRPAAETDAHSGALAPEPMIP